MPIFRHLQTTLLRLSLPALWVLSCGFGAVALGRHAATRWVHSLSADSARDTVWVLERKIQNNWALLVKRAQLIAASAGPSVPSETLPRSNALLDRDAEIVEIQLDSGLTLQARSTLSASEIQKKIQIPFSSTEKEDSGKSEVGTPPHWLFVTFRLNRFQALLKASGLENEALLFPQEGKLGDPPVLVKWDTEKKSQRESAAELPWGAETLIHKIAGLCGLLASFLAFGMARSWLRRSARTVRHSTAREPHFETLVPSLPPRLPKLPPPSPTGKPTKPVSPPPFRHAQSESAAPQVKRAVRRKRVAKKVSPPAFVPVTPVTPEVPLAVEIPVQIPAETAILAEAKPIPAPTPTATSLPPLAAHQRVVVTDNYVPPPPEPEKAPSETFDATAICLAIEDVPPRDRKAS